MKSRNITSLFMGKSNNGNFIAIVGALLLVTIFAVSIMSCGSLSAGWALATGLTDPPVGIDKVEKDAEDMAPHMPDALLAEEIRCLSNKSSELEKEMSAIRNWKKYPRLGQLPDADYTKYETLRKKNDVVRAELWIFTKEKEKRDSKGRYDGCFTPETKILMADGSLKNISDVVVGDILKSYNEETDSLVTTKVVKTYEFNQDHYYLINKSIKITDKHRFFTDSGWKRVCDLKVSDKIRSQGKFIEIGSIDLIAPLDIKVYNLEVDKHHSFLVSDGVDPYVVHNSCGDGDGDGDITK